MPWAILAERSARSVLGAASGLLKDFGAVRTFDSEDAARTEACQLNAARLSNNVHYSATALAAPLAPAEPERRAPGTYTVAPLERQELVLALCALYQRRDAALAQASGAAGNHATEEAATATRAIEKLERALHGRAR